MKKYYYGVLFVLLNTNLLAQKFSVIVDPVDSTKLILKEIEETDDEPISTGADSSDLVISVLNRIALIYQDLHGLEQVINRHRKAINTLKNIASTISDTTYQKHAKNVLFEPFEGSYKMFIDQVDTFNVVLEKLGSGNTRIRETGVPNVDAKKYTIVPLSPNSIQVNNININGKIIDVVLHKSETNDRVYKTLPKTIPTVYNNWIIPKIKIRKQNE